MKLIIAGGRDFHPTEHFIEQCLLMLNIIPDDASFGDITEIVSGGAPGIDTSAYMFATLYESLKFTEFKADWDKYGNAAGPIRNKQMAEYADVLLLIWNDESKGSNSMKKEMLKLNKPIYEVILRKNND